MKNRLRKTLLWLGGLTTVITLSACGALRGHHSPEEHLAYMTKKVTKKLDLDDSQVIHLKALEQELVKAMDEAHDGHDQMHKDVIAAFSGPQLDQQALLGIIRDKTTMVEQKSPQIIAALGVFYNSLNPQQQATLREHLEEHSDGHRRCWKH